MPTIFSGWRTPLPEGFAFREASYTRTVAEYLNRQQDTAVTERLNEGVFGSTSERCIRWD